MGYLDELLAAVDNIKRVGARNISDLTSDPTAYAEKIVGHLRNQNAGVVPVAAGGELTNRPMTREERIEQAMGSVDPGGGMVGSIKNVQLLRNLLGPDSPQVRKIMAGVSPERALRGYQPMETGGAYPVLGNNALRYENARGTFNPNVVHYDASGGEQALQVAGLSHILPTGDRMPVADRLRGQRTSQLRLGDLSNIPEDQAKFVDYDPWFQQFGPKRRLDPAKPHEFYINSGEGMVDEGVFDLPMNLKMRDILNDPDLRKEYNMSLAVPADSKFHQLARILRDAE
jgi:hypothetical protein